MYKITIEQIETKDYVAREYEKIADTGNEKDGGAVYGYVTSPSTREVRTTVLEQTVEALSIPAVIRAINNLV